MNNKGWPNEPIRHGLSSKGVETSQGKIINKYREPRNSEKSIVEYGFDIDYRDTFSLPEKLELITHFLDEGKEDKVLVNNLIATDPHVSEDLINKYTREKEFERPIDVVEYGNKKYILDGHHRAVSAMKAGVEKISARILEEEKVKEILKQMKEE